MAKKDGFNNIVLDTFTSGAAIDLLGYNSFTFAAKVASAGAIKFAVTESDDNTTFTAVPAEKLLGNPDVASATLAKIGYKGDCRYIKVTVTASSPTLLMALTCADVTPVE